MNVLGILLVSFERNHVGYSERKKHNTNIELGASWFFC